MATSKIPRRPRVVVPQGDIEQHLQRQLRLLEKSCVAYDAGDRDEYGRIATAIRVIVYDNRTSRSLLSQLSLRNIQFSSYARPISGRNLLPDSPLTLFKMGVSGSATLPMFDASTKHPRRVTFDLWWNEDVIRLQDDERLKRSEVVLIAANQDGGAHVDPELDEVFHRVSRLHEASPTIQFNGGPPAPMADVEKAVVRHIGFELLESVQAALKSRAGNNGCSCGSGRKHRYCCGKRAA
jgi:hypothetical protein